MKGDDCSCKAIFTQAPVSTCGEVAWECDACRCLYWVLLLVSPAHFCHSTLRVRAQASQGDLRDAPIMCQDGISLPEDKSVNTFECYEH